MKWFLHKSILCHLKVKGQKKSRKINLLICLIVRALGVCNHQQHKKLTVCWTVSDVENYLLSFSSFCVIVITSQLAQHI